MEAAKTQSGSGQEAAHTLIDEAKDVLNTSLDAQVCPIISSIQSPIHLI
jgi:hypothetical protein